MVYKFRLSVVDGKMENELVQTYTNVIGWGKDWVRFKDGEFVSQAGIDTASGEYITDNPHGEAMPEGIDIERLFDILEGRIVE